MSYKNVKEWRRNTKLRLVESFGGSCCVCGYNKCVDALEFHHIDPLEKEFSISSVCTSWEKIVNEVKKCIMLCSNCHREIHSNIIDVPPNVTTFNDNYIKYNNIIKLDECPICGNLKPIINLTCSRKCAGKKRCKVDWDNYDLELLYKKIGTLSGVAKYIGNISDISVKKQMIKQGII